MTVSGQSTNHQVDLSNLIEKTTYYYKINSCNGHNICNDSETFNFQTLDLTAPYLASTSVSDITNTSANVSVSLTEEAHATLHY